jgi:hypothetical protein
MHRVFIVERRVGIQPPVAVLADAGPVAGAEPSPTAGLAAYSRGEAKFKLGELSYRATGFWGLPEFDTPGFGSAVAAELAEKVCPGGGLRDALFINPGVGHLAIHATRSLGLKKVVAASRDELSLRAVGMNLATLPERARPAYSCLDALMVEDLPPGSFDLLAESPDIVPERDWIGPAWLEAERLLRGGGIYLVYCTATELARLEKRRPSGSAAGSTDGSGGTPRWSLLGQKRKKGFVASAWRRG